ncbi:MAG: hypothetical protein KatS3mg109_1938 [Pirellulaceae bacterium]|nr:MAG: hypothetical protein KatS3mg109_1938 [Pirellulaceae bacterium]
MSVPRKQRRPPLGLFPDQPSLRLYDRVIATLRVRHYSRRTEQAYVHGIRRRHHLNESSVSKAIRAAVGKSDIRKRVMGDIFRHSFATHLRELPHPLGEDRGDGRL